MHIRSITIQGFKSFADKVTIDLTAGISAIVGPNGCGKSNVIDAVRWCFGSQSPKQMRGASMQDVIFAGSSKRPPAGFAEVVVTFSNEDRRAPSPWADIPEISVARRVDRSGEGEYRLNGARVRLRDVQELLMDCGYGEYSIVQQGSIGEIVKAKPEDVRRLIEQASRMTKYRARRQEAQAKMERTEENLSRLQDLLSEIERQLSSLKRQAEKARQAQAIDAELRAASTELLARQLAELRRQEATAASMLAELDDQLQAQRTSISLLEAKQEEQHDAQAASDRVLEQELAEQRRLQDQRATALSRLAALRQEVEMRRGEQVNAQREAEELAAELEVLTQQAEGIAPRRAQADHAVQIAQERVAELDRELRSSRDTYREFVARQEALRDELVEALSRETELRAAIARGDHLLAHTRERLAQIAAQLDAIATREREDRDRVAAAQREADTASERERALTTQLAEVGQVYQATSRELAQLRATREREVHRLHDAKIEHDKVSAALANAEVALNLPEGAEAAVTLPWGRVAPKPGFEDLVETVLLERFRTLVVQDASLQAAVRAAVSGGNDRVRWFVAAPEPRSAAVPPGFRPVRDLLQYDSADAAWIEALTDGIWISDTPLDENTLLPAGEWEILWDTQGTAVDRRGVWSAGPLKVTGTAHLAARRTQLAAEITAIEAAVAQADAQIAARERELETLAAQREELDLQLTAARRRAQEARHALELASRGLERHRQERLQLEQDAARLEAERERAANERSEAEMHLGEAGEQVAAIRAALAAVDEQLKPLGDRQTDLEQRLDAARAELEQSREQALALARETAMLEQRRGYLLERSEALRATGSNAAARQAEIAGEIEALEGEVATLNETLYTASQRLERAQAAQAAMRAAQIELERNLREHHQALDRLLRRRAEQDQIKLGTTHRIEAALDAYQQRWAQPFAPPSQPDPRSDEDLMALRDQLEAKRARLGAVNPEALQEYEEVRARYEHLTAQRDDLSESLERLRASIRKMNQESRERFKTAFEEVNRHFGEIFPKLFRGGHAELRLVDPDDWLESGIEVIAQPPGTKLSRLELLSGGQSAMTAIALILAIFMTHPSPFCILDEVDAPLDDANVHRFNQVLVELNEIAQILLITHNKQTMEVAESLIGITMEERGITKALPVRLS